MKRKNNHNRNLRKLRNLLFLSSSMLAASSAQALTYTWSKAVTDATNLTTNWSSGSSWIGGAPVSASDTTLAFGYTWTSNSTTRTNTLTNNVANPFLLNVLTLGGATPTAANGSNIALINIAGSPLEFVSNGMTTPRVNLSQLRSNGQVVSFDVQSNVVLTNDTLFTGNGTANFTVSGGISGGGILTKEGSSALTLSGPISSTGGIVMNAGSLTLSSATNSYIGGTSINGGTLSVASTGTLGQNLLANSVSIAAGARLNLSAAGNTGANQTITLTSTAGSLATLALGYNGVPNAAIAQADTNGGVIAINGVTGYNSNLSTVLTGKNLFLGGTGTSTFTGGAATLAAGNGNIYRLGGGGGSISFNTANQLTGANSVQVGSTATGGTGTVIFGAAQNYTLGTTISAGSTLRFDLKTAMPATGAVSVNSGATLGVTVNNGGTGWGGGAGNGGIAGLTNALGGQAGGTVSFAGNSSLLLNVTVNTVENSNIGNGGATNLTLIKEGGNSLTLGGNNSYSGGTRLTAGTLIADSANALGTTGNITFQGGTLQYTANSAANNYGSRITNSTSTMLLNTNGQNVTLSNLGSGNTGGLTKSGAGKLTLSGTNSYSGTTTLSTGSLEINGGTTSMGLIEYGANTSISVINGATLNTSGNIGAGSNVSNVSFSVVGGGSTSTWNLGGGNFRLYGFSPVTSNKDMTIDGAGVANSAVVTNIGILEWGYSTSGSDLLLTDGGRMGVNSDVRIGSTYYGETGINNTITIEGGVAKSTMTVGQDFYVGYGDRAAASSNTATVDTGGQLTVTRDMYVGHVNNTANTDNPSTANKLTVTGNGVALQSGNASMRQLSVGYAVADGRDAGANIVEVTNGGQLTTGGTGGIGVYIGRAANAGSTSNANTMTVTGTNSSWNAGNQNVLVGFTNNASAASNNNILTVGSGGTVTGINGLTLGSGTGTETGNELVMLGGGSLTATTITVSAGNTLRFGNGGATSGLTLNGNITNNGSMVFNLSDTITQGTNFDSAFGGSGSLTQNGSGIVVLNGDNSYSGATNINSGTLQVSGSGDINGSSAVNINGGTLLYNSSVALTSLVNFTSGTVAGTNLSGISLTIGAGQTLSPGNSPGTMVVADQEWATDGTYIWEINNATGTAGTDPGWDLLSGTGTLNITATAANPFDIMVTSLTLGNAAGLAANFNPNDSYTWLIADFGSTISSFDASVFNVDPSGFQNTLSPYGEFNIVRGETVFGGDDTQIYLTYSIPEPSTALLGGLGVFALLLRRRRA